MKETIDQFRNADGCRIFYHIKPDGDAVCSAFSLALALNALSKKCQLFCEDPVPEIYRDLIDPVKTEIVENGLNISVDAASPARLGIYRDVPMDICIDHHDGNTIPASIRLVEPHTSSCSEIIFHIIREMGVPITKQIADLLYTGLLSDSSCFRSVSTNPATLENAAGIAACGADIVEIARRHFLFKSRKRIRMENALRSSFHFTGDGHILGSMLRNTDYQSIGFDDSETEGLNELVDQCEEADMAIVVRECDPGYCTVSVRSRDPFSALEVCRELGGGGHTERAGCVMRCSPDEALSTVEEKCLAHYRSVMSRALYDGFFS